MVNSHKEKQLNCLMKSLSEIDGDLLGDVEPARPMRLVAKKTNRKWQRLATVAAALAVLVTTGVVIRQVLFGGVSDQKYSGYPFVTQRAEGAPADAECAGEYRDSNEGAICVVEALDRDKMLRAGTIAPNVRDAISQLADRSAKPILLSSYSVNSLYSPAGLYQSLTYLERGAGGVTRDELAHFTYGEAISKLSNQNAALSMAADNQNLLPLFVNALIVPRSSESSLIPSFSDASGGQFYT
ncbi:MAG TPA: hypothetical protein VFD19_02430, partial [Clostridia bacterium]|nr:hypothetical protein [Clostridia bacterium]